MGPGGTQTRRAGVGSQGSGAKGRGECAKGRGFRDHARRGGHCYGDASAFGPKPSVVTPSFSSCGTFH